MSGKIGRTIAFIGAGNMAEALIGSLTGSRAVAPKDIIASDVRSERLQKLKKKYGIRAARTNAEVLAFGDVIILAVKPQQMRALLQEIGGSVSRSQVVISIAAGITTKFIEGFLKKGVPVVRVMPNTPALIGAGAAGFSAGKFAKKPHRDIAEKIFSACGLAVGLEEKYINAVTALSGSGPAYIFFISEILEEAGVSMGLSREKAGALARQTIYGAGKMLKETDTPAAALRNQVTSPGGTTEAAIRYLQQHGFEKILKQAIARAEKRAQQLAQ